MACVRVRMAAREKERCTRIDYLWRVSHHYSHICPELASFWGLAMRETSSLTINDRFNRGKLLDLAGPSEGCARHNELILFSVSAPVTDRLCPGCGALLHPSSLPSSSSVRLRTVSKKRLKKLRRKNDIVWLGAPAPRAKSYMVKRHLIREKKVSCHGDV